jgi:membrane fusion protein, multidrug efflux system
MRCNPMFKCVMIVAVIISGISLAQPASAPAPALPPASPPAPATSETRPAAPSGLVETLHGFSEPVNAYLNPQKVAVLSAEVSGIIERIPFEPGRFVRTGDVLIQLNTDLVSLRVERLQDQIKFDTSREEARVTYDYRARNLEIVQKLFDTTLGESIRVGSVKELEEAKQLKELAELGRTKAKLGVMLLELELKENQKILERHSIKAPFNGVIVPFTSVVHLKSQDLKKYEVGEAVQPGQMVIAMMKVDRLRVQWILPLEQLGKVHLGQKARVVIDSPEESSVDAVVVYKSPTVETTGQFIIEVEFENPPVSPEGGTPGFYLYRYRPGMPARVILE